MNYIELLKNEYLTKTNAKKFLEESMDDGSGEYQLLSAYANSLLGNEFIAQSHYELAKRTGFIESEQLNWYRSYGSTLRINEDYLLSIDVLQMGLELYPDDKVLKGYLSMSAYSARIIDKEALAKSLGVHIPEMKEWALASVK